jgi:hypothetical protein
MLFLRHTLASLFNYGTHLSRFLFFIGKGVRLALSESKNRNARLASTHKDDPDFF